MIQSTHDLRLEDNNPFKHFSSPLQLARAAQAALELISAPHENHVVSVNHFRLARVTKQALKLTGRLLTEQSGFSRGVIGQPSGHLHALHILDQYHFAPGELTLYTQHPNRQKTAARIS